MKPDSFKITFSLPAILAGIFLTAASCPTAQGCASCGCTLNSDWGSQEYSAYAGLKMDLFYTFIDQTHLRRGTGSISGSGVPVGQELEDHTRTHTVTLGLEYDINPDWGVLVQVPYLSRDHATFGETHADYDSSSHEGVGDSKVIVHYQGLTPGHNLGIELGLKLPTGSFSETFASGETLDRGLQLGTGTTDLIAGVYYFDQWAAHWGWFAKATVQAALGERGEYRPGTAENVSLGIRYTGMGRFIPQLQLNGSISGRDTGTHADNFDSGGTILNVSPGFSVEMTKKTSAFVFVQAPVFQNLNGYQLAPRATLFAGVHATF